jgi:hypothetical protein
MITDLFKPIEGLSPFIIYCLHSNNSLKTFFGGEPKLNLVEIDEKNPFRGPGKGLYVINKNQFIPNAETCELLKNSLIFPLIFWEWLGFHEWIEIELFLKEFRKDFEVVKEKIFKSRFKNLRKKSPDSLEDIDMKNLSSIEVVTYILNVLCSPKQFIIGAQHILMKNGTLKKIRQIVNNMVKMNHAESSNIIAVSNDGKTRKRSSIDRSKGNPFNRNNSSKSGSGIFGRSGSLTGDKLNRGSKNNLESNDKLTRNNSIGTRFTKLGINDDNVNTEKENYFKAHCSLKIFKESNDNILAQGLMENNIINIDNNFNSNFDTSGKNNSKLNLNNNSSKANLNNNYNTNRLSNNSSKPNLQALSNYNLNNTNVQLLENCEINNFVNYYNRYNLYNYIGHNKNLELSNINENSADQIHTTNLESEFDMYKRDENVIVPKQKYFNAIKNLFDYEKIDGFHIYDYDEYMPYIKMIQTNWRCYKSRKVYKIFRYVCKKICIIQKFVRGWITKRKYKKFKYANRCIVFIQRMYKRRYFRLSQAATVIQSHVRRKNGFKRYLDKLAKKDVGDDDSEEEQYKNYGKKHLANSEVMNKESSTMLKKELQSISMSKYEKRKSIDQTSLIKRNQLNMSLLAEMEVDTDKRKILDILMNNSSVFKGIGIKFCN